MTKSKYKTCKNAKCHYQVMGICTNPEEQSQITVMNSTLKISFVCLDRQDKNN